jgi:prevent-host-death family protein
VVGAHEFRERFGYWMQLAAAGTDVVITRHGRTRLRLVSAEPPPAAAA